ncbi:MAG TPA: NUDIX domain-containing protein [Candidatus Paceibacterota bacterium]
MQEELIDVTDEQGNKTGEVRAKSQVHKLGLWHRTIFIYIMNSKGNLLLQQRALVKESSPGFWDAPVAGHISAGQTSIEAAKREALEELGLALLDSELEYFGVHREQSVQKGGAYVNNEFHDLYLVRKDLQIGDLKLQVEEVAQVRWVSLADLHKMVSEKDPTLLHHNQYALLFARLDLKQ